MGPSGVRIRRARAIAPTVRSPNERGARRAPRSEAVMAGIDWPRRPLGSGIDPGSAVLSAVVSAWRGGGCLVVLDDCAPEPAARLAFPAEAATPEQMAFAVRHGSGFVTVALRATDADRLGIPVMTGAGSAGAE